MSADLERLLDVAEAEGAPEEPVGIMIVRTQLGHAVRVAVGAALLALKARLRKLGEFVDLVTMRNWSPVVFRESHAWALARVAGSEAGRAPWRRGRRRR